MGRKRTLKQPKNQTHVLTARTREEIMSMLWDYCELKSLRAVGKKYLVSGETVGYHLRKWGVETAKCGAGNKDQFFADLRKRYFKE